MTKLLSSLVVLLASSAAFAYPAVGDYAQYSGTVIINGAAESFTLERTIMSFNSSTNVFQISEATTMADQVTVESSSTPGDELLSQGQVTHIVTYCSQSGGVSETLTVAAGTFATCRVPLTNDGGEEVGTAWIGDATFGFIKIESSTGIPYSVELSSFRSGN